MLRQDLSNDRSSAKPMNSTRRTSDSDGPKSRPAATVLLVDQFCCVPYYNSYLAAALSRIGIDVRLASVNYHYDPDYFPQSGVHRDPGLTEMVSGWRIPWAFVRRPLRVLELMANTLSLALKIWRSRPDILHVQYLALAERGYGVELWLLRWARRLGIPIVYTVHNVLPQDTGDRLRPLYQRVYRLADILVCHTDAARAQLLAEFGVPPDRAVVIPHGPLFHDMDRPTPAQARQRLGLGSTVMFLCHGGIKPYKGIEFLLEAWRLVVAERSDVTLVVAGPGEEHYLDSIRRLVTELGLEDSVRLDFRFAPADELPVFFQAADALLYPYKEITASGALMTGLTFAKPVIASRLPAFEEILGDSGAAVMVPYGDTAALAGAIVELADRPDERVRLAQAAGRIIAGDDENSWDSVAIRTRECYDAVRP